MCKRKGPVREKRSQYSLLLLPLLLIDPVFFPPPTRPCLCPDTSEIPTKCVSSTVTLDINASVQYIDFEGRSDGDAMRRYLSTVKARQLVSVARSRRRRFVSRGCTVLLLVVVVVVVFGVFCCCC